MNGITKKVVQVVERPSVFLLEEQGGAAVHKPEAGEKEGSPKEEEGLRRIHQNGMPLVKNCHL